MDQEQSGKSPDTPRSPAEDRKLICPFMSAPLMMMVKPAGNAVALRPQGPILAPVLQYGFCIEENCRLWDRGMKRCCFESLKMPEA